jgi:putative membrane protein
VTGCGSRPEVAETGELVVSDVTEPAPRPAEIDARFLLANERTLLAWIRTSLTLVAGGVGVQQFGHDITGRRVVEVILVALGAFASLAGAVRYQRADSAIRRGDLPPVGRSPMIIAGAVVVVCAVVLIAVLAHLS